MKATSFAMALIAMTAEVNAYSSFLLKEKYCNVELAVGTKIMGKPAVATSDAVLTVSDE